MNEPNEQPSATQFSTSSIFSIRRALLAPVWLVTLVVLFYAGENWRGNRAWENYKREMAAKGEPLELSAFVPRPVTDDQNFAMTPFLAPLFDYKPNIRLKPGESWWRDTNAFNRVIHFADSELREVTGGPANLATALRDAEDRTERESAARAVLKALETCDPVLDELRSASQRPFARFNIHYGEENLPPVPHLALIKKLCVVMKHRALAELALGRTQPAFNDVKFCLRLIDSVKDEPFLISHLVRMADLNIVLPVLREALARQQWTEAQLEDLQNWLTKLNFIADFQLAMRAERIVANLRIEDLKNEREHVAQKSGDEKTLYIALIAPRGWYFQNMIAYDRFFQKTVSPSFNLAAKRVYPMRIAESDVLLEKEFGKTTPYNVFAGFAAKMSATDPTRTAIKFAVAQSLADQATIACALDRYRLVHNQYPEKLEALTPRFLEQLPQDVVTGQELQYHRTDDGQFALYSIGWNQQDDGGVIALTKGKTPHQDFKQGDWLWAPR